MTTTPEALTTETTTITPSTSEETSAPTTSSSFSPPQEHNILENSEKKASRAPSPAKTKLSPVTNVFALDLGSSSIRALVAGIYRKPGRTQFTPTNWKLLPLAMSILPSEGIQEGEIVNVRQVRETLERTIQELHNQLQPIGKRLPRYLFVGVPATCVQMQEISVQVPVDRRVSEKELEALRFRIQKEYLSGGRHGITQILPLEFQVKRGENKQPLTYHSPEETIGAVGNTLLGYYLLIDIHPEFKELMEEVFQALGNRWEVIYVLQPLALYAVSLPWLQQFPRVAVVDIGASLTNLFLAEHGRLKKIYVLREGAHHATHAIVETFKQLHCMLPFSIVEKAKVQLSIQLAEHHWQRHETNHQEIRIQTEHQDYEYIVPATPMLQIVDQWYANLADKLYQFMEQAPPYIMLVTGGGSKWPTIQSIFSEQTGINHIVLFAGEHWLHNETPEHTFQAFTDDAHHPLNRTLTTLLGLALHGAAYLARLRTTSPEKRKNTPAKQQWFPSLTGVLHFFRKLFQPTADTPLEPSES